MPSNLYRYARYYEIAFGFVNPIKQTRLFESFIRKYSLRDVVRVLDVACGTALQLRTLAKQGYHAIGLDLNKPMLDYLNHQAVLEKIEIETMCADMTDFSLNEPVDFAYIMMGSIVYTKSVEGFLSHLATMSQALAAGGLYLIENAPIHWTSQALFQPQTWKEEAGEVTIKATYALTPKNELRQTCTQTIELQVSDQRKRTALKETTEIALFFPEELRLLIEKEGSFELIGFFERDSLKRLRTASPDNFIVLRKK